MTQGLRLNEAKCLRLKLLGLLALRESLVLEIAF